MAIFNCYVSSPEGNHGNLLKMVSFREVCCPGDMMIGHGQTAAQNEFVAVFVISNGAKNWRGVIGCKLTSESQAYPQPHGWKLGLPTHILGFRFTLGDTQLETRRDPAGDGMLLFWDPFNCGNL